MHGENMFSCLVSLDQISDCTLCLNFNLFERTNIDIIKGFCEEKILSRGIFVQRIDSGSLTGFNKA